MTSTGKPPKETTPTDPSGPKEEGGGTEPAPSPARAAAGHEGGSRRSLPRGWATSLTRALSLAFPWIHALPPGGR